MITSTIDTKRLTHLFSTLKKRVDNTAPLMRSISRDMVSAVEDNFEQEGRKPKWKKLKASTIKQRIIKQRKKKGKWPGRILQMSGRLINSISSKHTNKEAIVGANVFYAPFLQKGTAKMEARPFLKFTQSDITQFENTITNHLGRGVS